MRFSYNCCESAVDESGGIQVGCPSWIHIEPCAALRSQPLGGFWKKSGSCASPPRQHGLRGAGTFGRNASAPPGPTSEVDLFRDRKGIINLDAEIPDGTLNLAVAEQ